MIFYLEKCTPNVFQLNYKKIILLSANNLKNNKTLEYLWEVMLHEILLKYNLRSF